MHLVDLFPVGMLILQPLVHVTEILQTLTQSRDHAIVVLFVMVLGITSAITVARPSISVAWSVSVAGSVGVAGSLRFDTAFWTPWLSLIATSLIGLISP